MKIEQGYTLSQFVDYATSHNEEQWTCKEIIDFANSIDCYVGSEIATKIHDYNNFLKQPLSKEMFVNPVHDPMGFGQIFEEWQEAEKKVIFENSKLGWCEEGLDVYEIDGFEIFYNHHTKKWFTSDEERELTCLGDLFEATKGQLKLKNVEL